MQATMAKKKPESKPSKNYHKEPRESFHLPARLRAALATYIERTKPRPGKSAVMRLALEEFLERVGLWPPPDEEAE